ncbi:peptide-methionine (S)-S-oxide reductase MsrA [Mariniblastus sp.]|nr:peptide-methionine (S)-S-oxide reductase MsrA [Mariniblastus sp.]
MKYFSRPLSLIIAACLSLISLTGCEAPAGHDIKNFPAPDPSPQSTDTTEGTPKMEIATFGGGCFWCTEAIFQQLKGVNSVKSGYMGGHVDNPTYEQVCGKQTGHVEVIQIEFDPSVIRFEDLLHVHWKTHDPTTMDQQGNDKGPQYRSAVFYHDEVQQEKTASYKKKLNDQNVFGVPVVTVIEPAAKFWEAEDYHQNYFGKNPNDGYCQFMIPSKLKKLKAAFADKIKTPEELEQMQE